MSLLVPAYPGCPGSKAVKRSLLLLLLSGRLKTPLCIIRPNFVKSSQTVAEILQFFCDFQDGGCCQFGFSKIRNFKSVRRGLMCVTMPYFIKIGQTVAEIAI